MAAVHVASNDDGVCWSSTSSPGPLTAFRRAASLRAAPEPVSTPGPQVTAEILATIAAAQIERSTPGPDQPGPPAGTVTFLDRRTLRTTRHQVTPHPFDAPARPRSQPAIPPPLPREELAERWQRLSDNRFGAFAELDDTRFRQLPLKVTLARMSDPCGLLPAPPAVVGAGADPRSARERAMLRALATYASTVVDPRLLVDADGRSLGSPQSDPVPLLGSVRDGSVKAFVRAVDLSTGRERLLPAHQAFPALRGQGQYHAPAGASAALDWQLALTDGLRQHCARLTVSYPSLRASQPVTLTTDDFDHDPVVRYLAAMVRAASLRLTLRDLTGPVEVPVVACTCESGTTVYGAGPELGDALKEALTGALFEYQHQRDPALQAAYPNAKAPVIWTAPESSGASKPDRLARILTTLGQTPCVFALDHDRAVHDAFPHLLQITLLRP